MVVEHNFKMDKKASIGKLLTDHAVYITIILAFLVGMFLFINSQMNGAAIWEDYYSKEISKVVNIAQPGDEITIDIHKATEVAKRNDMINFDETFVFHNKDNKICVKLSLGRQTCYKYFNNVDIIDKKVRLAEATVNILTFKIIEKQNEEEE